jgi:hypothetical protein
MHTESSSGHIIPFLTFTESPMLNFIAVLLYKHQQFLYYRKTSGCCKPLFYRILCQQKSLEGQNIGTQNPCLTFCQSTPGMIMIQKQAFLKPKNSVRSDSNVENPVQPDIMLIQKEKSKNDTGY